MKQVIFNFDTIETIDQFYGVALTELQLPHYFGNNPDTLWDCVITEIQLPVEIRFVNMSLWQFEEFDKIIRLFEDAADELGEKFAFSYYLFCPESNDTLRTEQEL